MEKVSTASYQINNIKKRKINKARIKNASSNNVNVDWLSDMRRTEFKTFDLRSNANCEFPSENIQNQTIDSNIHQRVLSEDINRERTLISERNFEDMVKSGIDGKIKSSYFS